jgi:putative DNA methylase
MRETPMAAVVRSWKSFTANEANRLLGRAGTFWQPEYFDRYIRDEEHLGKAIRYIENNPVKAGLARLPEEWIFNSAYFRSRGRNLDTLSTS